MNDHTELEAARFVRAALELIRDAVPLGCGIRETVTEYMGEIDSLTEAMDAPPWTPERPETDLPWSAVLCGDEVLAPNGQWYEVDAWSRIGNMVAVILVVDDRKVKSVRPADGSRGRVRVRRGPEGQAADMFTNAGFSLEALAA